MKGENNMKKYNYKKVLKKDIYNNVLLDIDIKDYDDIESLKEYVKEASFVDCMVTGNEVDGYTANECEAEEYLCHNLDIFKKAAIEFDENLDILFRKDVIYWDMLVRCYLVNDVVEEIFENKTLKDIENLINNINDTNYKKHKAEKEKIEKEKDKQESMNAGW